MTRITWAESHTLAAINHCSSHAQGHCRHSIAECHGRHWIEVVRPSHSRKIGIKPLTMRRAHDLLDDDRHLFFLESIWRRPHIGLSMLAEGRSIDSLDRIDERIKARR